MTNDQLRTGAALVRSLVEGDETARGPLSDFVEEFGLPGLPPFLNPLEAIPVLRSEGFIEAWTNEWGWKGQTWCRDDIGHIASLGLWPAWAWEGTEATTHHS